MTRNPSAPYDVGYGKPPTHSRFKPGCSGNMRGRPKGRRNLVTELEDALAQKVTVTENGRTRKLSKREIMVMTAVNKAVKGDPKAFNTVIALMDRLGLSVAAPEEPRGDLTPDDQAILAEFLIANGAGEPSASEA